MFLKSFLEKYGDKKIKIFVDMDGVVADYVVGASGDYHLKRPLWDSIKKLEEVSQMPNVEMYILSVTALNKGYDQKQTWLDKNMPFIKKENRIIPSREANDMEESYKLKINVLTNVERDGSIIVIIDDDQMILKAIKATFDDVVTLKDTVLVD